MNERADAWPGRVVSVDEDLDREFADRLADSSSLAFRVAYSVLRQRQDAEDVAQEAFTKAHRSFRQLNDRDKFRAWLVRMTWRLAIDARRGGLRRERRELQAPEPFKPPTTEDRLISEERSTRLWAAIDALPDKLRLPIVLSAMEGHGITEVATLLGVPAGTVKSRLFDARKRLQELLS